MDNEKHIIWWYLRFRYWQERMSEFGDNVLEGMLSSSYVVFIICYHFHQTLCRLHVNRQRNTITSKWERIYKYPIPCDFTTYDCVMSQDDSMCVCVCVFVCVCVCVCVCAHGVLLFSIQISFSHRSGLHWYLFWCVPILSLCHLNVTTPPQTHPSPALWQACCSGTVDLDELLFIRVKASMPF